MNNSFTNFCLFNVPDLFQTSKLFSQIGSDLRTEIVVHVLEEGISQPNKVIPIGAWGSCMLVNVCVQDRQFWNLVQLTELQMQIE